MRYTVTKMKTIVITLICATIMLCILPAVVAAEIANAANAANARPVSSLYHFSFAVGEAALFKNDRYRYDINPPLLIFDTVYVELYDICALLNLEGRWLQFDDGDIVVIAEAGGADDAAADGLTESLRFNKFSRYMDLTAKDSFFSIGNKIYVPADEIAGFAGYGVTYDGGVMTMSPDGAEVFYAGGGFGVPDVSGDETTLYEAYGEPSAHVVNPYRAYSYENMIADARRLERMYPELIRISRIGYSVEGRELLLIELGGGDTRIFVCGTHHAREYISATYLMYAVDQYAYARAAGGLWEGYDMGALLDSVQFCIVPMINPDGVNLVQNGLAATADPGYVGSLSLPVDQYGYASWKANVDGVDLNRNYDYGWTNEKAAEYPRGYANFGGDEPLSEPETRAVSEYILSGNFEAFLSFHTQGQVFYYAGDDEKPAGLDRLVRNATGFSRTSDRGDPGGSFMEFAHGNLGKTVMTVELCNYVGPYPYPDASFDNVWRPARNIMPIFAQFYSNR